MARRGARTEGRMVTAVERLNAEDDRDRRQRKARLRRDLKKVREIAKRLERELALLGDHESQTDWNEVFERLGSTFTAKEMGKMTGARAGLVASIVHRWRAQGRIVATSRGQYRKTGGRGRRTKRT